MVLELKSRLPQLRLHLALPYPEQAKRWSRTDRLLYEQIKEHADRVYLVSMEYSAVCMKNEIILWWIAAEHAPIIWSMLPAAGRHRR